MRLEVSGAVHGRPAFTFGGVLASTWIGRTLGHAEEAATLVKPGCKKLVANDDNYALAA